MTSNDLTARDREFPGNGRSNPLEEPRYGTALQATYVGFEGEEYDANRARPASTWWALLVPALMVTVALLKAFGVIG